MKGFFQALSVQRWDDHRFYHHSRINQSLHLLSAMSFAALTAWDPVLAEDKPVGLPEVKVIANTPLAPATPGKTVPRLSDRPTNLPPED